ncbi:MAG: SpoIIE family protein phosphatase [Calditrichia bacterium]
MFKNVVKEEIVIPAQMSYLPQVRDFIEKIGKRYNYTHKVVNSFKLVVDEACTNIIRHGYRDIKNGQIVIRAIVRSLSLTMVIIDYGKSFDPRQAKNPDLHKYVSIGKKGGLGIFMMRKLMDDIKYNVTARGNELRLTKMREKVERAKPLMVWDSLTLRAKFSLLTSLILTLLAILAFLFFNSRTRDRVMDDVFSTGRALSTNLAQISWEPMNNGNEITLYENSKSIKENHPELVSLVMITDENGRPQRTYPLKESLLLDPEPVSFSRQNLIDSVKSTMLYKKSAAIDSNMYVFVHPIKLEGAGQRPLGFSQVWVNQEFVEEHIRQARFTLILILLGILLVGYIGSFLLITSIMGPFHKLAGWVRQVGHGTVDEDELDIDAGDEVGEIAQAFNEMTSKFREAQVNLMEQQRMQRELQVAQEIQQMLLPDDFPEVKGYDITSYYQAAKEVGGDLFDFVEVDDHTTGICVADVSGKGVPGSMVMTMIRTALRLEARGNKNPAEVLSRVNAFITDDIRKGMFVTAFYIILDSRERMISFSSAGHNPMILYRGKSKETYYLNPPGFPIGITLPDIKLFDNTIKADKIRLHPDDILVVYTDGITEAMNTKRELYGEERFLAAIRKFGNLDVVDFVKEVKEDILNFASGYEQNDDITLVAIKENMAAVDVKLELFQDLFQLAAQEDTTVAEACQEIGVSSSTYYKYRKVYQEGGYDSLREMLHGYTNLGLRHLSIEVKTRLYDVIRENPEYGPKRISDALNSEKYNYTEVTPRLIYEELKRAKLSQRRQRERFVERGGKRRLKPPGTPLLTLDGEVMVGFRSEDQQTEMPKVFAVPVHASDGKSKERILSVRGRSAKETPGVSPEPEEPEPPKEDYLMEENEADTSEEPEKSDNNREVPEAAGKKQSDVD